MTELASIIRRFAASGRWLLLAVALGVIAAIVAVYQVGIIPPKLERRGDVRGVSSSEVLVDTTRSSLVNASVDIDTLAIRAGVFSKFTNTPAVKEAIANRVGIAPEELAVTSFSQQAQGTPTQDQTQGQSASALAEASSPYRVEALAQEGLPVMTFRTTAPTPEKAASLAAAASTATVAYLRRLEGEGKKKDAETPAATEQSTGLQAQVEQTLAMGEIVFRSLGSPETGSITIGGTPIVRAVVLGLLTFLVSATVIVFLLSLRSEMRRTRTVADK